MEIYRAKGDFLGFVESEHDHPRDPEEDDFAGRFHDVGRIMRFKILLVRISERGKRPLARGKPGIEGIRVLFCKLSAAFLTGFFEKINGECFGIFH